MTVIGAKRSRREVSAWPPSGPLTRGDALAAGRVDARRLLRLPPRATSYHPACSYPHWLRPRRHAKQQHLAQRPDVIRQSRGPGIMTPPEGIRERTDNKRREGCARYSRWRDMTCPEIGNGEPAARIDDTVPEDAHGHCDPCVLAERCLCAPACRASDEVYFCTTCHAVP